MKTLFFRLFDLLGVNALFRRLNHGRIKALLYHNVTPGASGFDNAITPEDFEDQLRHLNAHYNVIGIDQSGQWRGYRPDRVNVLITFDDAFINNLEVAVPILVRHRVPALFFLIADCVETGSPPPFAEEYEHGATVDRDGALSLIDAGMTVGSHSLAHTDFSAMSDKQAEGDAKASRKKLETMLGCPVSLFAFPWGRYRPGQEERMTRIYERVFLTKHGFAGPDDRLVPRNEVAASNQLRAAASGALDFGRGLVAKT